MGFIHHDVLKKIRYSLSGPDSSGITGHHVVHQSCGRFSILKPEIVNTVRYISRCDPEVGKQLVATLLML